jgi:hypothetical protein
MDADFMAAADSTDAVMKDAVLWLVAGTRAVVSKVAALVGSTAVVNPTAVANPTEAADSTAVADRTAAGAANRARIQELNDGRQPRAAGLFYLKEVSAA